MDKINTSSAKKHKDPIVSVLQCISQVINMYSVLTICYIFREEFPHQVFIKYYFKYISSKNINADIDKYAWTEHQL